MAEDTLVEAEIWSVARTDQGNAVLIRPIGSDVAVPIFIGPLETQSIVIGLGGVQVPRPLTHDLAMEIIRRSGRAVARVEICDLKEGTFFARLVLSGPAGEELIDSRPSDALALAVRAGCPVFIAEHVVEEAGVPTDLMSPDAMSKASPLKDLGPEGLSGNALPKIAGAGDINTAAPGGPLGEERRRLSEELARAVEAEDYERAAILRDRLRELEDEL